MKRLPSLPFSRISGQDTITIRTLTVDDLDNVRRKDKNRTASTRTLKLQPLTRLDKVNLNALIANRLGIRLRINLRAHDRPTPHQEPSRNQ